MSGPLGPRPGISSGILPGSSSGRGGSPGSRIGGGASGFGLPGGIPGGGSVGVPGVAGGISGGSIGIYIVTLRFSPRSGSSALSYYHRKLREMAAIVPGLATRHAIEGKGPQRMPEPGSLRQRGRENARSGRLRRSLAIVPAPLFGHERKGSQPGRGGGSLKPGSLAARG